MVEDGRFCSLFFPCALLLAQLLILDDLVDDRIVSGALRGAADHADLGFAADKFTGDIIRVPPSSRFVAPLTTVVALQLFAYYFARAKGCEIDHPRNLAKSVTVE